MYIDNMEVDSDFDQQLLQQFSSMGTTDKDVLITEFQKLIGDPLNPASAAFFLDMNNWNLQAAIGSYYDFEQPKSERLPLMSFVRDITIGEGESVPPSTRFIKTWRIKNTGDEYWPPGCSLKFLHGDLLGSQERVMVENLAPGQVTDIAVEMASPEKAGIYQGQWRMTSPTGRHFGEIIWVIISVEQDGLLGLTQQLSRIGNEFIPQTPEKMENPFSKSSSNSLPTTPMSSPSYSILAQNGSPQSSSWHESLAVSPVRTTLFQDLPQNRGSSNSTEMEDDSMVS